MSHMRDILATLIMNRPDQMITYAEYINTALYHTEFGYYMNDQVKIGRAGDFITTSNISDIYGKIIAKWYASIHSRLDLPAAVCEIGGGNGRFAKAFLEGWSQCSHLPLSYTIIESSPFHRKLQKENLMEFTGVHQYKELGELPAFNGLVFSNELFDALPVHVIQKKNGELYEVMVTYREQELTERLVPLENESIRAFINEQEIELREGQRIEIPLAMEEVIKQVSQRLVEGLVITVDYGYTKEEWMEPGRKDGSLRGYYQQKMHGDILQFPGMMDITSHVHFDALIHTGEKYNLEFITKLRQDEFLLAIGILDELNENYDPNPFSEKSKQNRAIRNLVIPGGMSSAFHVIVQGKKLKGRATSLFV